MTAAEARAELEQYGQTRKVTCPGAASLHEAMRAKHPNRYYYWGSDEVTLVDVWQLCLFPNNPEASYPRLPPPASYAAQVNWNKKVAALWKKKPEKVRAPKAPDYSTPDAVTARAREAGSPHGRSLYAALNSTTAAAFMKALAAIDVQRLRAAA